MCNDSSQLNDYQLKRIHMLGGPNKDAVSSSSSSSVTALLCNCTSMCTCVLHLLHYIYIYICRVIYTQETSITTASNNDIAPSQSEYALYKKKVIESSDPNVENFNIGVVISLPPEVSPSLSTHLY